MTTVKMFSDDICMKFGLDKCASLSITQGKVQEVVTPQLGGILPLSEGTEYKYLGILERNVFDVTHMIEAICSVAVFRGSKSILQTQLNSGNKVKAINIFAIPIMHYSAALLEWLSTELNQLDVKFGKLLSMNGAHHLKVDVNRLYLPRHLGGRRFVSLLDVVKCEKQSLSYYLHGATQSVLCCARDILQIPFIGGANNYVTKACQQWLLQWKSKALHGEFLKKVANGGELSLRFKWLLYGRLMIPTEAQVLAAQDQALAVRAVQQHIYGISMPFNCRVCSMVPGYVDHWLSGCTPLAATMYKQRHDRLANIVHWSLLKRFN